MPLVRKPAMMSTSRLLGLRPRDGAAGAAADDHDLVHVVKLGGVAERADNVGHIVAGLLAGEQGRRAADALHDDRHGAGLTIVGRDRDGHALAELVDAEHQELTRLCLAGDERGLERDDNLSLLTILNMKITSRPYYSGIANFAQGRNGKSKF